MADRSVVFPALSRPRRRMEYSVLRGKRERERNRGLAYVLRFVYFYFFWFIFLGCWGWKGSGIARGGGDERE